MVSNKGETTVPPEYIKHKNISIKDHQELNEKWVQDIIAQDSSILGLGELILKDIERKQPRAGRLDLLLQEPDNPRRYEVEIQLGSSDESHIIRTIEYWDIERKRYPQYETPGLNLDYQFSKLTPFLIINFRIRGPIHSIFSIKLKWFVSSFCSAL